MKDINSDNQLYGTKEWFENKFSDIDELGDRWGHSFRASQKYRMNLSLELIADIVKHGNDIKILDIGCGTCDFLNMIYPLNKKNRLFGTDISENAIKYNIKKFPKYRLKVDSLPNVSFESNYFDFIVAIEVINYLSKEGREEAIKNIRKCIKTHGYLLISNVTNEAEKYFGRKEYIELLSKYFEIKKISFNYSKLYLFIEPFLLAPIYIQRVYQSKNLNEIDYLTGNKLLRKLLKNRIFFLLAYLPLLISKYPFLWVIRNVSLVKVCAWLTKHIYKEVGIEQTIILAQKKHG